MTDEQKKRIKDYMTFMEEHPSAFAHHELDPILTDQRAIEEFAEKTGKDVGLIYRSPYMILLADVVKPKDKDPFVYVRIVSDEKEGRRGTVIVPRERDSFILLKNFRHAPQKMMLEFPRGFNEDGRNEKDNARKEIEEELGASVRKIEYLGSVSPNTGREDAEVAVYEAEIENSSKKVGYEGIADVIRMGNKELETAIQSGEITDSFTIAGYALYRMKHSTVKDVSGEEDGVEEKNRKTQIFVSYAHVDTDRVSAVIEDLEKNGYPLWFDQYIPGGRRWDHVIRQNLLNSSCLIAFVSRAALRSEAIYEEYRLAMEHKIPVIPVFLEYASTARLPEDLRELLQQNQNIRMRRMTHASMNQLMRTIDGVSAGDEFLKVQVEGESAERVGWINSSDEYINPNGEPKKYTDDQGNTFYQLDVNDLNPDAGFLYEMDDQWYPEEAYPLLADWEIADDATEPPHYQEAGLLQIMRQRRELFRGLLHSGQLLFNRANLINSNIFREIYDLPPDADEGSLAEKTALQEMINGGILVLVLYDEDTPYQNQKYQTGSGWVDFLRECTPYCLRMDWGSDSNNKKLIQQNLALQFRRFWISAAVDPYQLDIWEREFHIASSDSMIFRETVSRASREAMTRALEGHSMTRTEFYKMFVVADEEAVPDILKKKNVYFTLLDKDKPCAESMKKLADYAYICSMADAYSVKIKRGNRYLTAGDRRNSAGAHETMNPAITSAELIYALDEIDLQALPKMCQVIDADQLSFHAIHRIRQTDIWMNYISSLESVIQRSSSWIIDLPAVMRTAVAFAKVEEQLAKEGIAAETVPFAVSIILETDRMIWMLVYEYDPRQDEWIRRYKVHRRDFGSSSVVRLFMEPHNIWRTEGTAAPVTRVHICDRNAEEGIRRFETDIQNYLKDSGFVCLES